MTDTIFALSSGQPPAAVAVVRISGPAAHEAGAALIDKLPPSRTAAVRELRHPVTRELLDQALVLRFDGPASATGENIVEFQCHGGRAVVDAVLAALTSLEGLRPARPGEFTRRAFENGRVDLTEAEGLADLIEAETELQRRAALALADGGLRKQVAQWQARLINLSALAERAIDYDEDDEGLDPALPDGCRELAAELRAWLAQPRAERLRNGVRVILAGPPNVGKSSLLNRLVGEERAIVSDRPGTTRDHIEVPIAIGGVPMVLTDTAGLRDSHDHVEAVGVQRAERLIATADVLVWMGDVDQAPEHPQLIMVAPKADLTTRKIRAGEIAVSAVTSDGVAELIEELERRARRLAVPEGAFPLNQRQADEIASAEACMSASAGMVELEIIAEQLRGARAAFNRLTGQAGIENVLDALFARFCLGK